ncbi:antibiotic ABC transporter [Paracoccus siganidrum]|uniref:Antibiotic ABC transporter n=1 Tax=Paracoccus siganidrum TaxID=1276757 RepID=A0A419A5K6_9RHOB|nr:antibiotic ABC transporter [Paracoccus siganidrum]RJL10891.1 antibiotic ABC transporter [Paracoccus siganidrum]RMC28945.1 antibiotic ABC transporter [Paracoccus siganidrum]
MITPAAAKVLTSRNLPLYLWLQIGRIALESQMVIAMRMAGMMGIVTQSPGEPFRMVAEKQAAASESLYAAIQAASRGHSGDRVLSAALRPYGRRTRANSRRLARAKSA